MAVKLEELAQNFYDRHMSRPEFMISRLVLLGEVWDVIQNVVHFLQTAEYSTAISSKGDISLESSSRYYLALMITGTYMVVCHGMWYLIVH